VVKLMYFDEPRDSPTAAAPVAASGGFAVALSTNGLAMLLFGVLPSLLMNPCLEAIKGL